MNLRFIKFFYGFVLTSIMCGCGGASIEGATALFETASVTYKLASYIDTQAIVSAKPNTDTTTTAALTIVATPYSNATRVSSFTVRNMAYTYTQISGGTNVFTVLGPDYNPSLSFAPVLASGIVKDKIVDLGFAPGTTALTQSWVFDVKATYTVIEDYSGKMKQYTVPIGKINFV